MKMKTRRQRYDNEDPSAGHDSTPPPSKMMSPSSDQEDRRENHKDCPSTNYQNPNPLMATQLSTSAGLGHFLAIELLNNKDQKLPKDERLICVDSTELHNHQ